MNRRKGRQAAPPPDQAAPASVGTIVVREAQRAAITGLSRSQWFRLEQAGKAPRRLKLSGMDGSAHGWPLGELQAWVAERVAERDAQAGPHWRAGGVA